MRSERVISLCRLAIALFCQLVRVSTKPSQLPWQPRALKATVLRTDKQSLTPLLLTYELHVFTLYFYCHFSVLIFFICASLWIGHYQPIGLIPEGARNVQIKELSGFKNYLGELIFVTKTDLGFSKHLYCKEEFLLSINMATCDENASSWYKAKSK